MHYVIAVCDDEEDVEFLSRAFHAQPGKIPVHCMNAGVKLLEFVAKRPLNQLPFLIVVDQYLRDINSLTLLCRLRSEEVLQLTPVAIMSGFASENIIREYYRAGANCFYKKPLDLAEWNHMADCLTTLFLNNH